MSDAKSPEDNGASAAEDAKEVVVNTDETAAQRDETAAQRDATAVVADDAVEDKDTKQVVDQEDDATSEEDEAVVAGVEAVGKMSLRMHKIAAPFKKFWARKKIAIPVLLLLLAGVAAAVWFTPARYQVLNVVSSSSLEVTLKNAQSDMPIAGAEVRAGDVYATTNADGYALLQGVAYGDAEVAITKAAYEPFTQLVSFNESKVSLVDVALKPIGSNFSVSVTNSITEQPIKDVMVVAGEVEAVTDEEGVAMLIVPPTSARELEIVLKKDGFAEKTLTGLLKTAEAKGSLLPDGKNVFFSNRSGQIDLYQSDLSGDNQEVILKATGNENNNNSLSISPDNKWAAVVSTRDGERDDSGNLMPALFVVNLDTKELVKADEGAERFTIQGWADGRVVYDIQRSNADFDAKDRQKVKSYDPVTGTLATIASGQTASIVTVIGRNVLYKYLAEIVNNRNNGELLQSALSDGTAKKDLINTKNVYTQSAVQISPTELSIRAYDAGDDVEQRNLSYTYNALTDSLTKLDAAPPTVTTKRTIASLNNTKVAWVESRDGQDRLFVADANGENEEIITSKGSINYPIKWIGDDYIIFRVTSTDETADYVIGAGGSNEAQKIVDVFTQSYFYGRYF